MKALITALAAALALFAGLTLFDPPMGYARAETVGPDSLEQHLATPFQSALVGAEDRPVFAWVVNSGGVRNIWVASAGKPGRQRTSYSADDGIEISGLSLNSSGTRLAFVRGGDAEFPDGDLPNTGLAPVPPRQTVSIMDVAGRRPPVRVGEGHGPVFAPDGARLAYSKAGAIMLWSPGAPPRRIAKLAGRVKEIIWSSDGGRLLFEESRHDHSLIGILDLKNEKLRYLGATLGYSSDPVFSPDGRQIAFIQYREPPASLKDSQASFWSLRVADIASGAVRTVWTAPEGAGGQYYGTRGRNLFWVPSGDLLFPWERSGWLHIYGVRATGGQPARDLTPDANEVENFRPSPDGKTLVYSANPGDLDSRRLFRVPVSGGASEELTPRDAFAFFPVFGGPKLAATVTDARHPAHMVLIDKMVPLGPRPSITAYAPPQTVIFAASDGLKVHGQLFPGAGTGPHAAIVFVHGGPRRQMLPGFHPLYYYHNAYILNQELAARGYTVLSVNYRSGTNYGHAFREAPGKARDGASEYRDVLAGGKWLANRADVDPKRIGIWGGSWGGYLAALALARNSDLFAAGVDFHGVHAMVRPVSDAYSPQEKLRIHQLQWDSSPMGSMGKWTSPVLIIHGDDDRNVGYDQSLLLARELTARGVPFEEFAFPNERHDFFRFADWLTSYRATQTFFDRELGASR